MAHRIVCSVEWAKETQRPSCIPQSRRLRGSKGQGVRYEKEFAKQLKRSAAFHSAQHGQWFEYVADGEHGFCQPDVIIRLTDATLVFECKLRNIEQAWAQIIQLYRPILRRCYNSPVRGIVVSRSLSALPANAVVCTGIVGALDVLARMPDVIPVLHWLGRGPL